MKGLCIRNHNYGTKKSFSLEGNQTLPKSVQKIKSGRSQEMFLQKGKELSKEESEFNQKVLAKFQMTSAGRVWSSGGTSWDSSHLPKTNSTASSQLNGIIGGKHAYHLNLVLAQVLNQEDTSCHKGYVSNPNQAWKAHLSL